MACARLAPLAVGLILGVLGCTHPTPSVRVSDGRLAMGTILEITLYAANAEAGRSMLDQLFARVAELEAELTTWDASSAASRLNARAGMAPEIVPPALRAILGVSSRGARETDGVFDVSVGPLLALWRAAGERGRIPSPTEIGTARGLTGSDRISLAGDTAGLDAGMTISFDGIAKGWALDRLGEMLATAGVQSALLDFGGSSWLARGTPPNANGWRVLISNRAGRRHLTVLRDESLSVSESSGQTTEIEARRFSHVIDPRSGWPVETQRLTAVRAGLGAAAEIWSTALLIFSLEEGQKRIEERENLEALWIEANGQIHHTGGFPLERAVGLHGSGGR